VLFSLLLSIYHQRWSDSSIPDLPSSSEVPIIHLDSQRSASPKSITAASMMQKRIAVLQVDVW
jgi:hypothetical protein